MSATVWMVTTVLAGVGAVVGSAAVEAPAGAAGAALAVTRPQVSLPAANGQFDYQIGGAYRPLPRVEVVTRDRHAKPAPGRYNICYVNALQTQPGQLPWWRRHHARLLLHDRGGSLVHDPGWPGEVLLDISSPSKRRAVAAVVGRWLDGCADDGFDAVEPDNLDSFTRSRHKLSEADALSTAHLLAERSHADGLAIAQKNLAQLSRSARLGVGFDFAVSEECGVWHECASYRAAYGRHVIEIEYTDNGRQAFTRSCRQHGADWSVVLRDRLVSPRRSPRYAYRAC